MLPISLPALNTLESPPSWCKLDPTTKRPTGIDRSAAMEIRLGEVRTLLVCKVMQPPRKWPCKPKRIGINPLPNERPCPNHHGRIASGICFLTADSLMYLWDHQLPRKLGGDWRTPRANAMRPTDYPEGKRYTNRYSRARTSLPYFDYGLDRNPNKGAARMKRLGIWSNWMQAIRIEKWVYSDKQPPQYRFVCPGSFCSADREPPTDAPEGADWRLPPLSTRGRGLIRAGCPQLVSKLFLVHASDAEFDDAMAAQMWIEHLPERIRGRCNDDISRLIRRYGILFQPRMLVCRQCLGLKYGNHPDQARDSWHRRTKGRLPPK